jgi:hypothetical protein
MLQRERGVYQISLKREYLPLSVGRVEVGSKPKHWQGETLALGSPNDLLPTVFEDIDLRRRVFDDQRACVVERAARLAALRAVALTSATEFRRSEWA